MLSVSLKDTFCICENGLAGNQHALFKECNQTIIAGLLLRWWFFYDLEVLDGLFVSS